MRRVLFPFLLAVERTSSSLNSIEKNNLITNQICNIRQAKLEDIPFINNCNVQNLPENYEYEFFQRHITYHIFLSLFYSIHYTF